MILVLLFIHPSFSFCSSVPWRPPPQRTESPQHLHRSAGSPHILLHILYRLAEAVDILLTPKDSQSVSDRQASTSQEQNKLVHRSCHQVFTRVYLPGCSESTPLSGPTDKGMLIIQLKPSRLERHARCHFPLVRCLDTILPAQPAERPQMNPQRGTGHLVRPIHPRNTLNTLSGYRAGHEPSFP